MKKHNCRCCGKNLNDKPILTYQNYPKSAQFFPCREEMANEKGIQIAIYQCCYCGLIQIPGEPVPYYRDVIRATAVSDDMRIFRESQFHSFIKEHDLQKAKIIEIGAGCGEYMQLMKKAGGNIYGLEHRPESVEKCKEKGLQVYEGFLEEEADRIPEGPFDAFYIMNFLEHVPKPSGLLTAVYNNLTENAVGLVEVPNVDMIFRKKLFSEFISDHLMYFTKKTLTLLLEMNGFEVIEIKEIWYDYIISATVRRKSRVDINDFLHHKELVSQSVKDYLRQKKDQGKKVAAWGAGHQALADLSLLRMEKEIECVIDSAFFKQSRFTPATHIPVVAPDILSEKNIGAVLIMAAGYSDEISEIIRKRWPETDIAVLRDYGVEVIQ